MIILLESLTTQQSILLGISALFTGMTKTGINGLGLVIVPLMALAFGARESTGVLLPMLIMADIFAVIYYHRMARWSFIFRVLPWALLGIGIGIAVGKMISVSQFRIILSAIVLSMLILMVFRDIRKKNTEKIPDHWSFAGIMGLIGGFATMVGNAAAPVFALYLLAMHLPKNEFIGTGAWFFFIVNLIKVPFHIMIWNTINLSTFTLNLFVLPLILVGTWLGVHLVKLFPEKAYRLFVIGMTFISSVLLFV